MKTLEEYETQDIENLKGILGELGNEFGPSIVQRKLHLGFNRTARLLENAHQQGIIGRGSAEYRYRKLPQ